MKTLLIQEKMGALQHASLKLHGLSFANVHDLIPYVPEADRSTSPDSPSCSRVLGGGGICAEESLAGSSRHTYGRHIELRWPAGSDQMENDCGRKIDEVDGIE